jgi:hypothetical protein
MTITIVLQSNGTTFTPYGIAKPGQDCEAWREYVESLDGIYPPSLAAAYTEQIGASEESKVAITGEVSYTAPSAGDVLAWAIAQTSTEGNATDGSIEYTLPFTVGATPAATIYNAQNAGFVFTTTAEVL